MDKNKICMLSSRFQYLSCRQALFGDYLPGGSVKDKDLAVPRGWGMGQGWGLSQWCSRPPQFGTMLSLLPLFITSHDLDPLCPPSSAPLMTDGELHGETVLRLSTGHFAETSRASPG